MNVYLAKGALFEVRAWPPTTQMQSALLPDIIEYFCVPEYIEQVKDLSPVGTMAGPGEIVIRKTGGTEWGTYSSCNYYYDEGGAEFDKWAIDSRDTHNWRFKSLQSAAESLCPEHGLATFVSVRGKPSLLAGTGEIKMGAYAEGQHDVWLAAPNGLMKVRCGQLRKGTLVAIITETATKYGVTRIGVPRLIEIPKGKIDVVAPMVCTYNSNLDKMYIRFRRFKLDHYGFY